MFGIFVFGVTSFSVAQAIDIGSSDGGGVVLPDIPAMQEDGKIQSPPIILPGKAPLIPNISSPQTESQNSQIPSSLQNSTDDQFNKNDVDNSGLTEGMAEFKRFITGSLPEDRLTHIQRYGASFFKDVPSTFAPGDVVPICPDYVVGPGDQVRINIWGMVEGSWNETIDRQGNITIPRVGVIGIAGLTFEELENVLEQEFSKYYSNFEMSVTLGALKSVKVYVVGNVKKPGAYTVSSLATLINVLLQAGGPNANGSMRQIAVKRNGKAVATFDMYDLLMEGDKSKDIRMMPEDVIFVPVVGPQVAIVGNVRQPAIYELKEPLNVDGLINMAGGISATGFDGRVQMMRVIGQEYRTVFEGDLKLFSKNSLRTTMLKDGDFLRLFSVIERQSMVRLTGPVAKPGNFSIEQGKTRLKDVLEWAGGLLYYAANEAEITRVEATSQGPKTERLRVNVRRALAETSTDNILLKMNDFIFIRTIPDWKLYKKVFIYGEVKYPGEYSIQEGETLSSLLKRAGGFTNRAYPRGAIFTRESVKEAQQQQIHEMIQRMERELLAVNTNEMSSALTSEEARILQSETEQKRRLLQKMKQTQATGRIATLIADSNILERTSYDLTLEEGDALYIPSNPSTVQVIGSVLNPSAFVYDKKLNYKEYIFMAGGYTSEASPSRIYVLKADGTAVRVKASAREVTPWVKEFNKEEWQLIEPGDAIVVPQKVTSYKGLRQTRDYIDMITKMAITAASIHNITN
jgi:protein involved in polysaccharide export with SLBB domain